MDTRIEIEIFCDADRRVTSQKIFDEWTYTIADFVQFYEVWSGGKE